MKDYFLDIKDEAGKPLMLLFLKNGVQVGEMPITMGNAMHFAGVLLQGIGRRVDEDMFAEAAAKHDRDVPLPPMVQ